MMVNGTGINLEDLRYACDEGKEHENEISRAADRLTEASFENGGQL